MSNANEDMLRTQEKARELIVRACNFEGLILEAGGRIREQAKQVYGAALLDARLGAVSGLAHLLNVRSGVPGVTNDSINHRLILITTFAQGIAVTETLISEGQYAKAAAVLKQDYEILARLGEVLNGTAKHGVTPNARAAPAGSQRFYGELNDIAHPSKQELLEQLLGKLVDGEVRGISPVPDFNEDTARALYELHVFTLLHALRAAIHLFTEMYPGDGDALAPSLDAAVFALSRAEDAGFRK